MFKNKKILVCLCLGIFCFYLTACTAVKDQKPETTETNVELVNHETHPEIETLPMEDTKEETRSAEETNTQVFAWFGYVTGKEDGEFNNYLVLMPEGSGEVGLKGDTTEIEKEINSLCDKEEPEKYAHFWGRLLCDSVETSSCLMEVSRLRYGASATDPEPIQDWEGSLAAATFNSGDSTVFILKGNYPIQYSVHSNDPDILTQLESLPSGGNLVRISGDLLTGIPDVNGSRIQVNQLEVLEQIDSNTIQNSETAGFNPHTDWQKYTSKTYLYTFEYPPNAVLRQEEIAKFASEDLPEGKTPEEYLQYLHQEYGEGICVYLEYTLGYAYISAPANEDFKYVNCTLRNFPPEGEVISGTAEIKIADKTYTAAVTEVIGNSDSLEAHYEVYRLTLEDGTLIEFGSLPRQDANFEDYTMKGRDTILEIIQTYRSFE